MPGRDCTASAGRLPPEGTKPDRRGLTAAPHSTGIGKEDCAGDSSLPSAPRVRVIHPDTATGPADTSGEPKRDQEEGAGPSDGTRSGIISLHTSIYLFVQDLWASP